jgi:hypothetical protein
MLSTKASNFPVYTKRPMTILGLTEVGELQANLCSARVGRHQRNRADLCREDRLGAHV